MSALATKSPRILFLAKSSPSLEFMLTRMKSGGLDVTAALTSDSGVALCLGNQFAAVVLDAALIRNDDWTVAKSLKLIKPGLPILLLDSRSISRNGLPPDIDALAAYDDPKEVLLKLRHLVSNTSQSDEAPTEAA